MTKFNRTTKGTNTVKNYEGATSYSLSAKLELYSLVVTSMLGKKFYESSDDRIERLRKLLKLVPAEFVAKLASYTRNKMYLRSIPLVLAVELAKVHNGDNLVAKTVQNVVKRVDEITELLSYYEIANKRTDTKKLGKLSNQIQKGLREVFNTFDEYGFAKYDRENEVKLKDALFIVHPKAKDEKQQNIFDKIAKGELETPYTWEVELSALGQVKYETEKAKKEAVKQKWEELIDSGKLGYMALMRNLRNILEAGVDKEKLFVVVQRLANKDEVLKSKQLPFRFLSAYREIQDVSSGYTSMVLNALEEAIQHSVGNLEGFGYDTSVLIACDVSGSMQSNISEKSKIQNYDIGLLLGMLLQHKCKNVQTGIFGDVWKVKNLPRTNILQNVMELYRIEGEVGYSTNGWKVIKELIDKKQVIDKVMMFTDCQMWNSGYGTETIQKLWLDYKKIAPNSKLYLFDLSGYGNTPIQINKSDVFLIAGFSEKIFDVLKAIESGEDALSEIEHTIL